MAGFTNTRVYVVKPKYRQNYVLNVIPVARTLSAPLMPTSFTFQPHLFCQSLHTGCCSAQFNRKLSCSHSWLALLWHCNIMGLNNLFQFILSPMRIERTQGLSLLFPSLLHAQAGQIFNLHIFKNQAFLFTHVLMVLRNSTLWTGSFFSPTQNSLETPWWHWIQDLTPKILQSDEPL